MKKVGRLRLDELKENVKVLTVEEQRGFVGGDAGDVWRISGGYLYDVGNGTLFCADDDKFAWFPGVGLSTSLVYSLPGYYAAYQYDGTIHVEKEWLEDNFNIYDFAHEFGHYLQQIEMGSAYWDVIKESLKSATFDPKNHENQPYEKDATYKGYTWLDNQLNGSDNQGSDNQGNYNQGSDNQGNYNQGSDNQGSDNQGNYGQWDYNQWDYQY